MLDSETKKIKKKKIIKGDSNLPEIIWYDLLLLWYWIKITTVTLKILIIWFKITLKPLSI